jgi:hypothetical protein
MGGWRFRQANDLPIGAVHVTQQPSSACDSNIPIVYTDEQHPTLQLLFKFSGWKPFAKKCQPLSRLRE